MLNSMTQIKFTIETDIVASFKLRCAAEGVSMTSVIRQYMKSCQPTRIKKEGTSTRLLHRKGVQNIIWFLNTIFDLETDYRDSAPEQFRQRYDATDHACNCLSEAIGCLEDAF